MVGVPRSTGCRLCIKRRVRCDKDRPACQKCIKYGAECPGYNRPYKFVTERPAKRSEKGRNTPATSASPASSSASTNSPIPPSQLQSPSSDLARPSGVLRFELNPGRMQVLVPLAQGIWDMRRDDEFIHFWPWLEGLPDRLGAKATLDSAACALVLHIKGRQASNEGVVAQARTSYLQALAALQHALNHPTEWRTSETLCSAILLCLYESFAGTTSPSNWMNHAKGVGRLMQLRGPQAHDNDWDVSMISIFRGLSIMYSLFTAEDCFLAKKEWRDTWQSRGPEPYAALVDEFWYCLALCPSVVRQAQLLRKRSLSDAGVDEEEILIATRQTLELRDRFIDWNDTFLRYLPEPEEISSQDDSSPYSTMLTYASVWIGTLFMGYWASMLVIQEILEVWAGLAFEETNEDLLAQILKSVEFTSKGFMGPYRIGYSVRVALEFANEEQRRWIRQLLKDRSESFAATSPTLAPKMLRPIVRGAFAEG